MKNIQKPDEYIMCKEDSIYFFNEDEQNIRTTKWITFTKMKQRYLIMDYPVFIMIFTLLFDAAILFYVVKTPNFLTLISTICFILLASIKIFNFIYKAIMLKFGSSSWRLSARLHGAIHMVIKAYAEKGATPTFEEVKSYNYILSECSSFFATTKITVITFFFIMTFCTTNIWLLLGSTIALFVLLWILDSNGILAYFQILAVSKPTDIEIRYILKKFQAFEKIEKECYDYLDSSNDDLDNKS